MRTFFLIFASCLTGCLHLSEIDNDPREVCARTGEAYEGFTVTGRNKNAEDVGHIRCKRVETAQDKCELAAQAKISAAARAHDDNFRAKYVAVGVGYALYVVPGVVMKMMWDDENTQSLRDVSKLRTDELTQCTKELGSPATAH